MTFRDLAAWLGGNQQRIAYRPHPPSGGGHAAFILHPNGDLSIHQNGAEVHRFPGHMSLNHADVRAHNVPVKYFMESPVPMRQSETDDMVMRFPKA